MQLNARRGGGAFSIAPATGSGGPLDLFQDQLPDAGDQFRSRV
jgi:hypothetical protein